MSSLLTTNKQPQKENQLMNDSQASLIELADQLFTAYWGLPLHLRGEETAEAAELFINAFAVAEQCLIVCAPYATPEDTQKALWAVLERRVTEMAA